MTTTAGAGILVRFMLRQERRGLPWWLIGSGLLVGYQSVGSQDLYGTPEALAKLRATMTGNAALLAMSGPERLLDTIGGEVVFEIFGFLAILVGLMNMFLVGRHTRTDEETGRGELIRSTRTGRHAPLVAALCVAGIADLAVAIVVFGAAAGTGLPVAGSVLLGAAAAGAGIAFAAMTAVAVQVFENPRSVYGAVGIAIGTAFVLRAAGDIGNPVWSWLSPIGWGQRTFPYAGDRWWPLVLPLAAGAVLVRVALILLDRRDFGDGLLPYRPGRATASWALRSPIGLGWRLQRGSIIGWTAGLLVLGIAYGSFADSVEEYVADNPEIAQYLPGGAAEVVNSYLALVILISALLAGASAVAGAMRARHEETSGRAEPVLATRVSRRAWLGGHVTVTLAGSAVAVAAAGLGHGLAYGIAISDPAQALRLAGVALVQLPAVWLLVAVAVLAIGWLPRAAASVAWTFVGYCAVVAMFADSFNLPDWSRQASPFVHLPQAPLDTVTAPPLLIMSALAAAVLTAGFAGLARRDFGY
ncbi:ABC transporter permease [Kribbella sindirgiensis]|uniref:ABC transporter permease n=1 Tax=Kribbella sindirgiensis TaxID=1124744 RepID=A0A4R0I597_9ACTN|nr:ABC transporter permease [Kribbella sindirgiensis]TCC20571.1 ABC transporter permease [Kribbella sindirgiensis]